MRILLAHNYYQSSSPSGEDIVFDRERQLLENAGHDVVTYTRHNDAIESSVSSRVLAASSLFWSRSAYRDISTLIKKHRPDVAHFHNTFPQISTSAYRACKILAVPVVQTLHNYRLLCPGALLLREGRPCEVCVGRMPLPAIKHNCYRNSKLGTALVSTMLLTNRITRTYSNDVDCYICLTEFGRQRFAQGGLPAARLTVRSNALFDPPGAGRGNGGYALYVGRLSREKGVHTLIGAWQGIDYPLTIVGDGPMRAELEQFARQSGRKITFLGLRTRHEVLTLMQDATLLAIPSEWYEGFPNTVLEALATGTPLVVSAIGALNEIVNDPENGRKFAAGNAVQLRLAAQQLLNDPIALATIRQQNRALFDRCYSPSHALTSLEQIYRSAINGRTQSAAALSPVRGHHTVNELQS